MKETKTNRLSWKETISFSGGELGTNLLFAVTSAYLLVYYTNYAHVNAAIVGTIMLISKFFDAVSDIMMGHIEEKFAKPGAKARPWIKRMVIPYALSAIILFAVPGGPSRKILSPATAAKRDRESTCSFSKSPFPKASNNWAIRFLSIIRAALSFYSFRKRR